MSKKIVAWKLVAFDENDNEITLEPSNYVASVIDDFITEEVEEEEEAYE